MFLFSWRKLLFLPIAVVFAFTAYFIYLYLTLAPQLANADLLTVLPMSSKILDRNGELLYEIGGPIQREVVPGNKIPELLKQATVAAEDKNFYNHGGIDPSAIGRAMLANLRARGIEQGGSTITQQLAKNTFLTPERTLSRKISEATIAIILEHRLNKNEILTAYLNNVSYGSNIIGVKKASQIIFGKNLQDLSVAEMATLAALPKAPSDLSPFNGDKAGLIRRRDEILERLYEDKTISTQELAENKNAELVVKTLSHPIKAPHFSLYVRDLLIQTLGKEKVERGGLVVTTSLDSKLQTEVEKSVLAHRGRINNWGADNAAAIVLDPQTGEILAMLGSFDYYDSAIDGEVNVTISPRQPGSSFKPIIYSALFTNTNYSPASVIYDFKTNFNGYVPKNYSGHHYGPCTIRECLAGSLNIPAVKSLSIVGTDKALDIAEKLGLTTLSDRDRFGLSLALGAGEVKLLELTSAFGSFANQGNYNAPTSILKVTDYHNELIYEHQANPRSAVPPEVAWQLNDILSDNSARSFIFGPNSPLAFGRGTVAAKTGTTSFYKDAWTIGYSRYRAVGVWTGNSDGKIMRNGADGVFVAAPLWRELLLKAMSGLEYASFERPENLRLVQANTIKGIRSEYLASWQISGALGPISFNSEKPGNPAWEGPVRQYWESKRQDEQNQQNEKQPPSQEKNDNDKSELGGAPEEETIITSPISETIPEIRRNNRRPSNRKNNRFD